jgi:uncharacterized protein YjbI with pentapeptide repeats
VRYDLADMANNLHLEVLAKGIDAWNEWRSKYEIAAPDLSGADLRGLTLGGEYSRANLRNADLRSARLGKAVLDGVILAQAELDHADLRDASLRGAVLSMAKLKETDFSSSKLLATNFREAVFDNTKLQGAIFGWTIFGENDLRGACGLDRAFHQAPSTIGIDTLYRSHGMIPDFFLRGAGIPADFITYVRSLINAGNPLDFYSCFISYSSQDQSCAERLHADLQVKGVRVWFAPEDLKIGDKFRARIDESIRIHDKLLLVLSEHSIRSPWVEKEVEAAFEREHREKRTVLFPIRLDDTIMETDEAWAADIRRTRHIGDFTRWENHADYSKAFERLMRDLKTAPDDRSMKSAP